MTSLSPTYINYCDTKRVWNSVIRPLITITILRHQRLSRWGHPINILPTVHPSIRPSAPHSEFSAQIRPQISTNHTWQSKRPFKGNHSSVSLKYSISQFSSVQFHSWYSSNPPTHQHHPAHQPLMILLFLFTSRARILNNNDDSTEETGETRIGTLPIQADPLLRVPFHPQKQSHFIAPRPSSRCFCFYWLIYWTHSYGHSVALHTPYRYIRNSWIINSPKLLEFLRLRLLLLLHHPLTIFYLRLCCFKGKSCSISFARFLIIPWLCKQLLISIPQNRESFFFFDFRIYH